MTLEGFGDKEVIENAAGGKQAFTPYRMDLIPSISLFIVAKILKTGADKYGENNWQKISTKEHLNHALGHIYAFLEGDVQENHLGNAGCRILFALWTENPQGTVTEKESINFNYCVCLHYKYIHSGGVGLCTYSGCECVRFEAKPK